MGSKTSRFDALKSKGYFYHLAETFQALGDSSRVQIIWVLMQGEQNVSDLVRELEMSQPAISHHLRTLRNLRLVKIRRSGRNTVYSLDDEHIAHLMEECMKHVEDFIK